jgi:hypothetical protein
MASTIDRNDVGLLKSQPCGKAAVRQWLVGLLASAGGRASKA